MEEDVAIGVLRQVKGVLDKYGIEYWLDIGTLLGAMRDGKFIPWDGDIDLGIWYDNIPKIISIFAEFRNKGFKVRFCKYTDKILIQKGKCPICITGYKLKDNKATCEWYLHDEVIVGQMLDYLLRVLEERHAENNDSRMPILITKTLMKLSNIFSRPLRNLIIKIVEMLYEKIGSKYFHIVIPSHYFTNLSTIKFYGMEFQIPAKSEEYLAYRYGNDWRTPKKDYVYYKEDGAIKPS